MLQESLDVKLQPTRMTTDDPPRPTELYVSEVKFIDVSPPSELWWALAFGSGQLVSVSVPLIVAG